MIKNSNEGLSIQKFLAWEGKKRVAEGTLDDAKPATVLDDYRETCSEGSGQYDDEALRKLSSFVKVAPSDVTWYEKQMGSIKEDFSGEVFGVILQSALQAISGDPKLAIAFAAAGKA